jgi:two-component system nitrogen regulation response regulator GlnG
MPSLLIIDDEADVLQFLRTALAQPPLALLTADSAALGLELYARHRPAAVLLDVEMPGLGGLETFRRLREIDPKTPVIFVTGSGTTATAIQAMALGAYEYVLKPVEIGPLRELVGRALEVSRLMRVPALVAEGGPDDPAADPLIGRCPAMHAVYKSIGRVAPQDVTVLVRGESGTGKELVARAIYHYSRRADRPFLALNCAAIPESLLESELFGHEKGAFTGADRQRVGKFEQCSGGTLFLDEVGDMAPLTQTKLLRVLQEQRFERLGGTATIATDVRIIAATNRDLETVVAAGKFRRDLYYRLNVYMIELPPLRERGGDVALLAGAFLRRSAREMGKDMTGLSPEALECLQRYPWPGNVRELQSVVKHALLEATGPMIVPEFLPEAVRAAGTRPAPPADAGTVELDRFVEERLGAGSENLYAEWQAVAERRLLERVLRHTGGKISPAARRLGIHRATLRARLAALGIDPAELTPEDGDDR